MLIWRPHGRSISLVVANQSFNDAGEMLRLRGCQISMTVRKYKLILPAHLADSYWLLASAQINSSIEAAGHWLTAK